MDHAVIADLLAHPRVTETREHMHHSIPKHDHLMRVARYSYLLAPLHMLRTRGSQLSHRLVVARNDNRVAGFSLHDGGRELCFEVLNRDPFHTQYYIAFWSDIWTCSAS